MAKTKTGFDKGIILKPDDVGLEGINGELKAGLTSQKISTYLNGSVHEVITNDQTQTLTGKTVVVASNTITTAASGNLAATELNAALSELQTDIDTRATDTALQAHINNTTGAHAASAIANTPAGTIGSTTVQAALNELDGDIQGHITNATGAHAASAIANTPSGNLAATNQQAANNELQTDIDTRALNSDLTAHTGSTAAHGATGAVVGTTNTQTLTNKTLTSPTINTPAVSGGTVTSSSIITPARADVKQDTKANLDTYAATASNGQIVFATDLKKLYQVVDSALVFIGSGNIPLWVTGTVYAVGDTVIDSNKLYRANTGGTASASFATDIARWTQIANDVSDSTGILPLVNGGTNKSNTAVAGGVVYSDASGMLISAAGTAGQVLYSNGTSAPSFGNVAASSTPTTTKTTTYTILSTDGTIFANASGGAFTLTLPSAASNTNQILTIKKIGTDFNTVTISGSYDGGSNTTLNTPGETLQLQSDGVTYRKLNRITALAAQTAVASTITATTTNPVKGTNTLDKIYVASREGRYAFINFQYRQTAAGSGTAGSGAYLILMPSGLSIDTTETSTNTSAAGILGGSGEAGVAGYFTGNAGGASLFTCSAIVFDSTHFKVGGSIGGAGALWGSGSGPLNSNTLNVFGWLKVPIVGWNE